MADLDKITNALVGMDMIPHSPPFNNVSLPKKDFIYFLI
jgi:hypothetical protein